MTSSILNRLEDEIATLMEDGVALNITQVLMAPSLYLEFMHQMQDRMRYTQAPTDQRGFNMVSYHSRLGTLELRVSTELHEDGCDMAFVSDTGEKVYPLDEAINRILLEY